MTSAPAKKASRKGAVKIYANGAQKKAAAKMAPLKRATAPSQAAIMLHDLRPSVDALHDRVEKLRLRFS